MSAKLCRAGSFFPDKVLACLFCAIIAGIGVLPPALMAGTLPSITTQPSSLVVTQGNSASFNVSATGDPPLTYQWRFGGGNLSNATNSTFNIAAAQLTDAGNYDAVVANGSGAVTSAVARLTVRSTNGPVYAAPDGGWTYIYAGNAIASSLSAALDGTWNHLNGDDSWAGDGRGAGNGLTGGLSTTNGVVTIEDAVASGTSGNDNRRFYFTHNISGDAGATNANTLVSDGVTLSFRARLTPASDPLLELTNAPNGFVNVSDGKGMFGIRQAGASGMLISFSLNKAVEDTGPTTSFTFASAGLHMNNLNGDVRSANVDPGEGGTINVLPLDPTVFHEFWINIQDNGAAAGTHRVSIYMDGSLTPTVFNVTAGTGSEGSTFTNYLALGLPSTPQRGAFDVDFFAYRAGIVTPIGLDAPPGIVQQPVNATVAEGLSASFNVGVTGTPQFAFQWFKNGLLIPNATNRSYITPAATPADNSAQFVVVVSNDNGSITSSPPATLTVIPDTVPPSVLSVGSLDGQRIGICFSEKVTAASAQNTGNYSINGGSVVVNSATLRTNDGGQTAVLNVSGLASAAGTPFTVVASNIKDLSAAGNSGGGTASGAVLGLTAADVGIGGTDPIVAGSTFSCGSNQLEIVAGGSDIGGSSDGFHYVYQQRTGNFDVLVRAARLDASDRASKAGLIAREDLTPGSRDVSIYVTPSSTTIAADGSGVGSDLYEADYRAPPGSAATEWPGGAEKAGVPYPNGWMRLVRAGDIFTAYQGTNGIDWTQLGQLTNVLPAALYVGVGVSAHTNSANLATIALMQDFRFVLPPQIVSQPQSQIVTNGDSVQFNVAATGAGTLRYQWRFNGVNITGATNSTLNIASTRSSDAGTYQVTISNSGGDTNSAAVLLTVRLFDYGDAPDSYSTLRASNGARHLVTPGVYLGATIDVDLDGIPGSGADGDDTSGIDDEDGVRFISPIVAAQPASIEVVASTNGLLNGWIDWNGNGTWADAGEQVFTNQPVQPGTNLLQLTVSRHATAAPTFARFRFSTAALSSFNGPAADGEVEDYAVSITPQVDLSIGISPSANPIAVSSNLVLTLNVSNAGPSRASSVTVTDIVQGAVSFGVVTSSRGSCARTGNTVNCDLGAMQEGELASIQITLVPQAAGQITNQAQVASVETDVASGNNSAATAVLVEVPPSITTQPVSQTVTQGNNVAFTAAAQGTAPLSYQWWLNSAPLAGAQATSLSITNAQPGQAGDYALQASNRVGSVLSQPAHLTVLVPPGIAQQPQSGTNYAGRTVVLIITASGTAPFDYQWYFNTNTLLTAATNSTLVLTNAQKTQTGNYLVTVHNSAGAITSSVARVTIVEADFGDAPDSYGTTLLADGARHRLVPGIRLGTLIDFEGDGQPQSSALGDDVNGLSDEDGVIFPDPLYPGQNATVRVIASTNGILNAWLDMQANGNWTDPGDQVFTNQSIVTGTNVFVFALPANASTGATFARFRFSTLGELTPFGEAPDGEVEDYQVTILPASDLIVSGVAHPPAMPAGSDLTFGVIVSNRGPSTAHSVVLSDTLPPNASFLSANISAGSCSQNNGVVACNAGDLPSGAAVTMSVTVHPFSIGAYTNFVNAAASEHDPLTANNSFGDTQLSQQPPVITTQPKGLTATNGDNVSLSVQATGSSLLYQWRLNGNDVVGATNATLLLNSIQQSQAGTYVVRVSNFVGQTNSDPATITVIMPLRITSQPQNTTVVAGNAATLSVVVSGSGPIAYQWFFEGTPIVNGTNAILRIDDAQPSDGGQYTVTANNSVGSIASDPAILTVIVPPSIALQPQDQTNLAGSDVVLTVAASGTMPLSYQWYRNSSAIALGTNDSLMIRNVQKSDSGIYTVVVTNQGGAVTSAGANLVIREMDFGDAPDLGYPTLLAFNGARHVIVLGVHLGTRIDFEPDGQPNADATGDDLSRNDEDGVTFVTPFYVGEVAWLRVVASTNGFLDAWVDFNQDGAWVDAIEQVFASQPVTAGTNLLNFEVPVTALTGTTFARFRFSTTGGLSYDGEAADGEVEDYKIELLPAVELELKVVESPDPVWVGNTMTYSLAVTNHGPLTATSVELQDSLSPIVSFVSANSSQGSCSNSAAVVVCDLGFLADGDWATVDLTVQPITSGMVTNYTRVTAAEYDLNPTNSVDWRMTPSLVDAPAFANSSRIDVNDGGTALLYPSTIFVSGVTATVYKVTATLNNLTHSAPDDFDILLVGPNGQGVILMSDVGGRALLSGVTITFDDSASLVLPDNTPFISQTYKPANYGDQDDFFPPPAPPGPYTNKLAVYRGINPNGAWSLYVVDDSIGDAGFIGDGWSLQFSTIDPIADVGVQIVDSPHKVIVGSNLTYSVIASNSGPGWASGVRVHDSLPTNVVFVSAFSPSGSCSNMGGEIDCTAGQIAPGGYATITIVASPQQLGVISNYASVSCNERDFNAANNTGGAISFSKLPVDLVLLGGPVPDPVMFGQNVSYTLTASNRGPNGATSVVLSDTLPAGTAFVSATAAGGSCSMAGGVVTCQLPNVPLGAATSVSITITPGSIGRITNAPIVTTDEVDLTPLDNGLAQPTTVALLSSFASSPSITIASNGAATPYPASISVSSLTSTVYVVSATISNIQHASPDDLDVLLMSPSGQSVLLMSDAGGNTSVSGVTLQFDDRAARAVPDAGPLVSGIFRAANYVIGNENFALPAPSGPYETNLTAGFRNTNPNGAWSLFVSDHRTPHGASSIGGWSLAIGTVDPIADLQLTGDARPNPVAVGSNLVVTLTVSNRGPAVASGIVLSNQITPTTLLVSVSGTQGACAVNDGSIVCAVNDLIAGASTTVTLILRPDAAGTIVHNASVAGRQMDLVPANNALLQSIIVQPPPVVTAQPISIVRTNGDTAQFAVVATGADPLAYQWRHNGSDIPLGTNSLLILANVNLPDGGPYDVRVSNRVGSTISASASLTVKMRPVIATIGAQTTDEDTSKTIPFTIGDLETSAGSLQVFAHSADQGLLPDSNFSFSGSGSNRFLSLLPATNQFGSTTVTVTVTDGDGLSASNSFVLTVVPVNDLPVISAIASQVTDEDTPKSVNFTVEDVETAAAALTVTGSSSDSNLVPNSRITFGGTGANRSVTISPGADQFGSTTITLVVNDGTGGTGTTSFLLTVNPINDPPTIDPIPDQVTDEDVARTVPVRLGDVDSSVANLSLEGFSSNTNIVPNESILFSGSGSNRFVNILPATNQFGSARITVVVSDPEGTKTTNSFLLTVNPVNDPPVSSAIGAQTILEDSTTGPLALTIGDIETAAENLTLTGFSSDPNIVPAANIQFSGSGSNRLVTVQPGTNQNGSVLITVVVHDADGGASSNSFSLNITPVNDLPVISSIGRQFVQENGVTVVNFNVQDVETASGALVVSASAANKTLVPDAGLTVSGSDGNRTLTITPAPNQVGSTTITLLVADTDGGSVSTTFDLAINAAPSLSAIGAQIIAEDAVAGPLAFTVGDLETSAAALTLTGSSSDTSIVPNTNIVFSGSGSNRFVFVQPAANQNGPVLITVVVHDTDGGASSNSFSLNITPVNDLPVIGAIASQVTDEDVVKIVSFTVGDVETAAGSLVVSGSSSDTGLVPNSNLVFSGSGANRTLSITPAANQSGSSTITLTVSDADGGTVSTSFLLVVNPVNDPPALDAIANVTVDEDSGPRSVNLSGISSGAPNETQALSVSAVSSDPSIIPNPVVSYFSPEATGLLTFTPATNANGTVTITVTVNDGGASNNVFSRTFQVTVNPVNDPPTISSMADQGMDEDAVLGPISFTVADVESVSNLIVTGSSSNTGLVANAAIVIAGSGSSRTVTITPLTNQSGSTVITLTVRDPQGAAASTSFTLTVNAINDAPTISTIANQTINEDGSTAALAFVVGDSESAAATLVVSARSSNQQLLPDGNLVLGGSDSNRTIRLTPASNQSGNATVTLIVRDPVGLSTSSSFVLTVTAVNDAPTIGALGNQTINEDSVLSLPLTLADADSAPASLVLSATSSNPVLVPTANIVFSGSGLARSLQIAPATNENGSATIIVTVSDGVSNASTSFVLTVLPVNDPPTLNAISNVTINEDASLQTVPLTGIGSGAANESQSLSVVAISSNPALIPNPSISYNSPSNSGSLSFTPVGNANGSALITVTVSDGSAQFSRSFTVTVNPVNDAPTISAIANQSTSEDIPITIPFTVNDVDTAALLLNVSGISSNQTIVPTTNIVVSGFGTNRTVTITPAPNQNGAVAIKLTVSDGVTNASTFFTLTVTAVNDPPTLNPLPDINVTAPTGNGTISQTVNLSGISSGATNESQTLTVTASSSNTGVIPTANVTYTSPNSTGTLQITSARGVSGTSIISVNVSDGQATNTQRFVINLRPSANTAPTISAITNRTVNEDTLVGPIAFTISDSVTPANLLTLAAASSNPALVPTNNIVFGGTAGNRTVTLTPVANQSGTATITISVTDTNFGSVNTNFVLTVLPVNDPPTISTIAGQTIAEDTTSSPIAFMVNDVETPATSLTVTASSSNPSLVPDTNILLGGNGTNRALVITPAPNQFGVSTITLTVSDGLTSTTSLFVLTVNPINDLPTIAPIADQTTSEDTPTAPIALTVGDIETAAASLNLSASSSNPALISSFTFGGSGANRTLVITPAANQSGSATITLTLADTDGGSTNASFALTITPANDPPTLDPINNLLVNEGAAVQSVNLTGISSGAGENQTLAVTATSSNPDVVPNPAVTYTSPNATGSLSLAPVFGTNGSALITVTVNDGQAQNSTISRTFTVTVNDRPAISLISDQVSAEDTVIGPLSFTVGDRDTPADNLVLSATSSNPGLIPDANILLGGSGSNRTVRLTPLADQFGNATITVSATDSNNLSGSRTFVVVVLPVNHAPTLDALTDLVLNEDAGLQTVNLTGIGSGALNENQSLSVRASSSNPALVPDPIVTYTSPNSSGSLTFTPLPNASGTAVITIVVNDGGSQNNNTTRTFTVTLNPINDPPTLDAIGDLTINEDAGLQTIALTGISSGASDEFQTLSVTASNSNPALLTNIAVNYRTPDAAGRLSFGTVSNGNGRAILTVRVQDNGSPSGVVERSFTVTVTPVNDPPIISSIADQTIHRNETLGPILFTLSDVETAASDLTVTASSGNFTLISTSGITLSGSGANRSISITPQTDQTGSTVIQLVVTDLNGASATNQFLISVTSTPASPRILRVIAGPSTVSVVITSQPGLNYTLEATDSLADVHWAVVQTLPGTGSELTLQDAAPAQGARFYRVRVE